MDMGARVRVWVSNSLSQAEASSQPEGGQQVQAALGCEHVEQEETRRGGGEVPGDRSPQAVLSDKELSAVAVVQVVLGLLCLPFGGPQPAGEAEGIPGLVP